MKSVSNLVVQDFQADLEDLLVRLIILYWQADWFVTGLRRPLPSCVDCTYPIIKALQTKGAARFLEYFTQSNIAIPRIKDALHICISTAYPTNMRADISLHSSASHLGDSLNMLCIGLGLPKERCRDEEVAFELIRMFASHLMIFSAFTLGCHIGTVKDRVNICDWFMSDSQLQYEQKRAILKQLGHDGIYELWKDKNG